MPPDKPDPTAETAMVRPQVRTIQDPGPAGSPAQGQEPWGLTGWQVITMGTVLAFAATMGADTTAVMAITTAVFGANLRRPR